MTRILLSVLLALTCYAPTPLFFAQNGASAAQIQLPPITSGLKFFAEAGQETYGNGDAVATITDRSGSGFDATQGTVAARPIFTTGAIAGRSGYRFDGVNDTCTFSGGGLNMFNNVASATIIVVATTATVAAGGRDILNSSTAVSTGAPRMAMSLNTTAGNLRIRGRVLDGNSLASANGATALSTSTRYVFSQEFIFSTALGASWINGASEISGLALGTAGNTSSTSALGVSIGASPAGSLFYSGDIAMILIYVPALGTSDRQLVENWAIARY
jgi:hypothetical protein